MTIGDVTRNIATQRVARVRNRKHIFVYLVLKRVAHAKRNEIFVYLVLKRVF